MGRIGPAVAARGVLAAYLSAALAGVAAAGGLPVAAGDAGATRLDGRAGVLGGTDRMRYWVETGFTIELSIAPAWLASYVHTERSIFLDLDRAPPSGTIQLDRTSSRDLFHILGESSPGTGFGIFLGHLRADLADRPGAARTAVAGPALRLGLPAVRTELALAAGATLASDGIEEDTWTRLTLRAGMPAPWELLGLDLEYEALGDPWPRGGYIEVGPSLEVPAGDVSLDLAFHFVRIEDQPFLTVDDEGWGFWIRMIAEDGGSRRDASSASIEAGGEYLLGMGNEGATHRFLAETRCRIPETGWGARLEYEARRDLGHDPTGAYRVALGPTASLRLPAVTGGEPRAGWISLEFLHRSDHALDADPQRLAGAAYPSDLGPMIEHTNVNIFPRLTLATQGWSGLGRGTTTPAFWDAFAAIGRRLPGQGHDSEVAGQVGLRLNLLRRPAWTAYAEGILAGGGEAPEQAIELGWQSGAWSVFLLWNDYGIDGALGETSDIILGAGVRL